MNLRKWRALLLNNKLNDLQEYGLVSLYNFWLIFDDITPRPPFFPYDPVSFLCQKEDYAIKKHMEWLIKEVESIILIDQKNNIPSL